jgi:hypothetical protein
MIAFDNPDLGGDAERHFLEKMEKIAKPKYAMSPPKAELYKNSISILFNETHTESLLKSLKYPQRCC